MKNFNYTARDTSGAPKCGNIKAVDRAEALRLIKAQNLIIQSMTEGLAVKGGTKLNVSPRILALGVAVLILIIGGIIWRHLSKPVPEKKAVVKREQKVTKTKPSSSAKKVLPKPKPLGEVAVASPVELKNIVPPKTNSIALRIPPKVKGDRVLVPGIRNASTNELSSYATFITRSERMMSGMLSAKPGEMIVGVSLGRNFNQDFAASLTNTIVIYANDTEEMAANKEAVAWMKDEMRKLVNAGQSPEEILTNFRNEHNEIANYRSELQRELSNLKREGKLEEAEAFVIEANKMLEPYGTRPLVVFPVIPRPKTQ